MSTINWDISDGDIDLIQKISDRTVKLANTHGMSYSILDAQMDITAVHLNDVELDLNKLLAFDDGNFGHDVFGIKRHVNRNTGILKDCFLPRSAK